MRSTTLVAALATAALLVSACGFGGGGPDLPEAYGLYAVEDGRLGRLDGDPVWEQETWPARAELSPEVNMLVHDRSLLAADRPISAQVRLYRVASVRHEVLATGEPRPAEEGRWAAAELESLRVPVDLEPVPDRPEMVRVLPRAELEPGLYELRLGGPEAGLAGRFGVRWSEVDQEAYAAAHCVDRHARNGVEYRPCDEADEAGSLEVVGVRAERAQLAGTPTLIVEGAVVNSGAGAVAVPPLRVTLHDGEGEIVHGWEFELDQSRLEAGERAEFRTETSWVAEDVVEASVGFTTDASS